MSDIERQIEQYIFNIIHGGLVKNTDAVSIEVSTDNDGVLVQVQADKEDMGVLIGKEGQTVKAIRTLARVVGANYGEKVSVKVIEPNY